VIEPELPGAQFTQGHDGRGSGGNDRGDTGGAAITRGPDSRARDVFQIEELHGLGTNS
jgi:hypothetical protein